MILDEIRQDAMGGEVFVFFDMDGTIAEYDLVESAPMGDDFYAQKRPLFSMISKVESLSKDKNVHVGICSICRTKVQKESKILWLKKFLPFLDEQFVHIIVLQDEIFDQDTKRQLKGALLTRIYGDETVYLVEDDLRIIKSTKHHFPKIKITHFSRFLD